MDRRSFLTTTGAAAAAAAGGTSAAEAGPRPGSDVGAPAIIGQRLEMRLAVAREEERADLQHVLPELPALAGGLEQAAGGRLRVSVVDLAGASAAHIAAVEADAVLDLASGGGVAEPAMGIFSGLPGRLGLAPDDMETWLHCAGGRMLWDGLAAGLGFKPLPLVYTGPHGLWSREPIAGLTDLKGAPILARGLARDVLLALGAVPSDALAADVAGLLADRRLVAADWPGRFAALASGLGAAASAWHTPALNRQGLTVALLLGLPMWERLSMSERDGIESWAGAARLASIRERRMQDLVAARSLPPHPKERSLAMPPAVEAAIADAAAAAVERIAAGSAEARRIVDSYRAFRDLLTPAIGGSDHVA